MTDLTTGPDSPPVFPATRAGTCINFEDLEAHVAALLRLENVGVLLGSGASSGPVGGKTIGQIWIHFKEAYTRSYKWFIEQSFCDKDAIPNLETLLDSIEIASVEWNRLGWTRRCKKLTEARDDLRRAVIQGTLLKDEFWEDPQEAGLLSEALSDHRRLLQKITSSRQPGQGAPWLFTTNYDLAIEWAAESIGLYVTDGFMGLHNRIFSPQVFDLGYHNILAKGEARFGAYHVNLVKLHGSLSWQVLKDQSDYVEVPAASAWNTIDSFIKGTCKEEFNCPIIFPSAAKYLQTVGFVLGELMRRFSDFLSRPQTCLFTCGYSFADDHLNEFILRALQNPSLQLVIFLPEATQADGKIDFSACRDWVKMIDGLKSPQVTIVGGGDQAHFDKFVSLLPDPAIYDEQALLIRKTLKELRSRKGGDADDER